MSRRILVIAAIVAFFVVTAVSVTYLMSFGAARSADQGVWGAFGDYFGGILNPLFALAAFLSVLFSIDVQQKEARTAAAQLSEQTEIARKEFETVRAERVGEELLHVIRDIDARLACLLETDVSTPGTYPSVTVALMVAEAERLATVGGKSSSFEQFVRYAQSPGSVVEAPVREIKYLVQKLREFLEQYSKHKGTSYAPVIVYYADKAYRLLHMLEAVGGISPDTRQFFATVSDAHG
jgi:uncharacterized membrane protein